MSLDAQCIFCRIIRGEVPSVKIYEDDRVVVFLDIAPINPGHALVVPKYHAARPEELPEEYLERMMVVAARVAPAILRATNHDGYNLVVNVGRSAEQEIMHVHMHIIPRREGDGCNVFCLSRPRLKPSMEELREVGERIRAELSRG